MDPARCEWPGGPLPRNALMARERAIFRQRRRFFDNANCGQAIRLSEDGELQFVAASTLLHQRLALDNAELV